MTDTQQVLKKLLQDHVGRHNAITQSQLSDALGMNPSTLRSELRRLREERNIPIANQRNGYYIIQGNGELQDFIGHINEEIASKKQTIEHTLEAFEEFDGDVNIEPEQEVREQTYSCAKCGTDVPRSEGKWPKDGKFEGEVLCKRDYGKLVMQGEA